MAIAAKYFLWVWMPHRKVKSGYGFDSKEKAEAFFRRHFRDEPVKHEITKDVA